MNLKVLLFITVIKKFLYGENEWFFQKNSGFNIPFSASY